MRDNWLGYTRNSVPDGTRYLRILLYLADIGTEEKKLNHFEISNFKCFCSRWEDNAPSTHPAASEILKSFSISVSLGNALICLH